MGSTWWRNWILRCCFISFSCLRWLPWTLSLLVFVCVSSFPQSTPRSGKCEIMQFCVSYLIGRKKCANKSGTTVLFLFRVLPRAGSRFVYQQRSIIVSASLGYFSVPLHKLTEAPGSPTVLLHVQDRCKAHRPPVLMQISPYDSSFGSPLYCPPSS
jgi:hypothetical protein